MLCNRLRHLESIFCALLIVFILSSCSIRLTDCAGGPLANTEKLLQLQQDEFPVGAKAYLVLPNPIDSPKLNLFEFSSSTFRNAQDAVGLPGLSSTASLENKFLKVRQHSRFDSADLLVNPQELSEASVEVKDPKYSQVMAYHAITAISDFVKSLGFSVDQSRPLFVMVRSNLDPEKTESPVGKDINAYYVHNTQQPQLPRYIQLFGDVQYPLGADRDVFWHEFGHLFNESVSASKGLDEATERGAIYAESGALHECLADYLAESASGKGYIGKWTAKNIKEIKPGQPLRWAVSQNDSKNNFSQVGTWNPQTHGNRTYLVGEWCSRVLWDIRQQFQKEDSQTGAFFSDRTIFGAVALLGKNASMSEFRAALLESDTRLHCGLHQQSIRKAFTSKGFAEKVAPLTSKLQLQAVPVGFNFSGSQAIPVAANGSAKEILFNIQIKNPNRASARNVRLVIETGDPAVVPITNFQGFGDLGSNATISIVGNNYSALQSSVSLSLDKKHANGRTRIPIVLKVISENGGESRFNLELSL